ncbi:MAG: YtpR family tRNA-binding protein [Eubacterium ramulus]
MSVEKVCEILTSIGLEVGGYEKFESIRGGLRGLVIGEVKTCEAHPDSDHLHLTTVDLGDGRLTPIVCGAPNVAAGQKVVVATIGTVLYDGDKEFTIKKSKIRGQESEGMICAEDEIGIGHDHAGIIVLPSDARVGMPAAEYYHITTDYYHRDRYYSQPGRRRFSPWSSPRFSCLFTANPGDSLYPSFRSSLCSRQQYCRNLDRSAASGSLSPICRSMYRRS